MSHIIVSVVLFVVLFLLNTLRIGDELQRYNESRYQFFNVELNTIAKNVQKVSDSVFDNNINIPEIIDVFKDAHIADDNQKTIIRKKLHTVLKEKYNRFVKYDIQQLHFHLPNNDSFLRFHKPKKFGDNLTSIRASVKYVNENKKPIIGFEEGKIFNGYRFVYPLFDEDQKHIGSVEISSSLLSFKKVFEETNYFHLDYILTEETVLSKVFKAELINYEKYHNYDGFLIQKTLNKYNQKYYNQYIVEKLLNNESVVDDLLPIQKKIYSKFIDSKLYSVFFIPMLNDFTQKKVGYMIIFGESTYFTYFFTSIVVSYFGIFFLSLLIGYILYKNRECFYETQAKERYKIETVTDELTQLNNRKAYNQKLLEMIRLCKRYKKESFSLIIYDIDNFKSINDTYGHKVGDSVLVQLSRLVSSNIRQSDYLYRIGGEEFVVIVPHSSLDSGVCLAEKIRTSVEKELDVINGRKVTISMGVTEYSRGDTQNSIFTRADSFLYESKNNGKNKVTSDIN